MPDPVLSLIAVSLRVILGVLQSWSNRTDSNGNIKVDSAELLGLHKSVNNLLVSIEKGNKSDSDGTKRR